VICWMLSAGADTQYFRRAAQSCWTPTTLVSAFIPFTKSMRDHSANGVHPSLQILAFEWADPTSISGLREASLEATNARLQWSLDQLQTVPVEKIIYIQLSDALRLDRPLDDKHPFWDAALKGPLHMWSRIGRVLWVDFALGYFPFQRANEPTQPLRRLYANGHVRPCNAGRSGLPRVGLDRDLLC
jgi:hypothetical protein